jgi:aminopeptidase N
MSSLLSHLRRSIFVLILAFSSSAVVAQSLAPERIAPPVQWPRSHNYDVQHYRIKVSFDWKERSVTGETTITLRPFPNDLSEVELDAGQMHIQSVKLAQGKPLRFRYVNHQKLFITLDKKYAANSKLAITVNYVARPVNSQALAFIMPTEADKTRPYQIWSQGEAQTNHYWFPCYDAPNDKATSEIIATVEERFQVISNGKLIGVQAHPAKKTKTFHWKMNQPFSSYLISIIVGEYAEVRDRFKNTPVSSFVYKNQVKEARVSLGKLPQMVAFFSKRIGYDYPFPKYAQIMVRDFPGAMENITATTMTDTAVHDQRAHLDLSSDDLMAHELAHSWFGNLLTCRDWGELWLNESFATFMESVWTEHQKGRDDYLYEMYNNQQGYLQAWNGGYRRPIVTRLYHDPDSLFDAYTYPRGGAVVNMLRFVLGEEMFWKATRHYIKKHQWQNVETQQLVVAIEEATGQNLQWFFDQWLYKMGHPEFEITSSYDEKAKTVKLFVKQTQKPDVQRPWYESPAFFTMPVDVAITTASGEKVHRISIHKVEQEFSFPVDGKPLIVNFDKGNYLIKQVNFNRSDTELAYQLLHDSDVMGRTLAAIELKARKSEAVTEALAQAAAKDKFYGVRLEAARALSVIKMEAAKAALLEVLQDKNSQVRRTAINGLSDFNDVALADIFINIINTDQSYGAIAEAARALGKTDSPKAYEVLLAAAQMDSWQNTIRAGALSGLAALRDARSMEIALQYAAAGNSTEVRLQAMALLGAIGRGNAKAFELLIAALKEDSSSLQLRYSVMNAITAIVDGRTIPVLEEALKEPGLPPFAIGFINNTINQLKNPAKE